MWASALPSSVSWTRWSNVLLVPFQTLTSAKIRQHHWSWLRWLASCSKEWSSLPASIQSRRKCIGLTQADKVCYHLVQWSVRSSRQRIRFSVITRQITSQMQELSTKYNSLRKLRNKREAIITIEFNQLKLVVQQSGIEICQPKSLKVTSKVYKETRSMQLNNKRLGKTIY